MSKILIDGEYYSKNIQLKNKINIFLRIIKEVNNFFKKLYWKSYLDIKYLLFDLFYKKNIIKKNISMICITRERTIGFERLLKNIIKKTKDISRIEFLFLIDYDDKFKKKYLILLNKFKKHFTIKIYINRIIKLNSERINFLAEKSNGDILFSVSDDMIIQTNNWDSLIDVESSKFPHNSPYCLWPSVDANKYKFLHCAFPIINRKWFDILKYHSYPKFYHFYTDTWICELSKMSAKFLLLKKLFIKTFHPETNKKFADETYFRLRKNSKNYNDKIIFYKHENIRKIHAQKLINHHILS
jgi:hypothetical protein